MTDIIDEYNHQEYDGNLQKGETYKISSHYYTVGIYVIAPQKANWNVGSRCYSKLTEDTPCCMLEKTGCYCNMDTHSVLLALFRPIPII